MIPRFIHSAMAGAPVSAQTVSGTLPILDAALVTGFNIKTPSSVTVASGVATFNYLAAHGYEDKCWLRVAGSGAAALNADLQCAVPNSTTLTLPAPGVPDGPVSGSIETRVAPLGWERPFTGTNVNVYRSPNVASSRMFYRLDDSNAGGNNYLRLRGYEDMTSADAGTDPFPTLAQVVAASIETGLIKGTAFPWCVVGDDKTVYFLLGQSSGAYQIQSWGDFDSFKPADAYAAFVGQSDNGSGNLMSMGGSVKNQYLCRDAAGLVKSLGASRLGMSPGQSGLSRPYPGAANGGVTLVRPVLQIDGTASATSAIRGRMRGLMAVMEAIPAYPFVVLPSVPGITGRVLVLPDRGQTPGAVAFPIDEAW